MPPPPAHLAGVGGYYDQAYGHPHGMPLPPGGHGAGPTEPAPLHSHHGLMASSSCGSTVPSDPFAAPLPSFAPRQLGQCTPQEAMQHQHQPQPHFHGPSRMAPAVCRNALPPTQAMPSGAYGSSPG